jgi:hypothetical protein
VKRFPLNSNAYSDRYAIPGSQCVLISLSNSFDTSEAGEIPETLLTSRVEGEIHE